MEEPGAAEALPTPSLALSGTVHESPWSDLIVLRNLWRPPLRDSPCCVLLALVNIVVVVALSVWVLYPVPDTAAKSTDPALPPDESELNSAASSNSSPLALLNDSEPSCVSTDLQSNADDDVRQSAVVDITNLTSLETRASHRQSNGTGSVVPEQQNVGGSISHLAMPSVSQPSMALFSRRAGSSDLQSAIIPPRLKPNVEQSVIDEPNLAKLAGEIPSPTFEIRPSREDTSLAPAATVSDEYVEGSWSSISLNQPIVATDHEYHSRAEPELSSFEIQEEPIFEDLTSEALFAGGDQEPHPNYILIPEDLIHLGHSTEHLQGREDVGPAYESESPFYSPLLMSDADDDGEDDDQKHFVNEDICLALVPDYTSLHLRAPITPELVEQMWSKLERHSPDNSSWAIIAVEPINCPEDSYDDQRCTNDDSKSDQDPNDGDRTADLEAVDVDEKDADEMEFGLNLLLDYCMRLAKQLQNDFKKSTLLQHLDVLFEFSEKWANVYQHYPNIGSKFEQVGEKFFSALAAFYTELVVANAELDRLSRSKTKEASARKEEIVETYSWYLDFVNSDPIYMFWSAKSIRMFELDTLTIRYIRNKREKACKPSNAEPTFDFLLKSVPFPGKHLFRDPIWNETRP